MNKNDLKSKLQKIGIENNMKILLHVSLSKIGHLDNGPETLIERVIPSPFHIIGAVLIIVGNLVEIIDFSKFRRVKNVSE